MGLQYEVVNEDKKEYLTAQSLGWDSKNKINTIGRFSSLVYYVIKKYWSGNRISIISIELTEEEVITKFYRENHDRTKEYYCEMMLEFPESEWVEK